VDDLVEGVYMLMQSDPSTVSEAASGQRLEGPTIIGGDEYVTVDELVQTVIGVSGKRIQVKYVEGPVGVQARNPSTGLGHRFSKARIKSRGWKAKVALKEGIARTYHWIEAQGKARQAGRSAAWNHFE
jgi:nucleoside-diphosphate-sugar epimerase